MYRTTWSLKASKPICRNTKIQAAMLLWTQGELLLRWNPYAFDCFCPYSISKPVLSPKFETEQLVPCFHFLSQNLLELRGKITLTWMSLCRCYYWIKFSSLSNSNHVERRSVECHLIVCSDGRSALCLLKIPLLSSHFGHLERSKIMWQIFVVF